MIDFTQVKLGKKPKRNDYRTLQLGTYLGPEIVLPVPESADFSTEVNPWPMYGNDAYGDCTCAAVGHGVQLLSAMSGTVVTPTDNDVLSFYYDINNNGISFQPGTAQDEGADILSVIQLWKKQGMQGVSPFAFVEVDPTNVDEVKVAISLFGGLDIGVQLPLAAQTDGDWDTVYNANNANTWPGTWGGHSIWIVAFDAGGITCVTWGTLKKISWGFWLEYVDEAYAILPNDWQTRPNGFDFSTLEADLTALQNVE